MAARLRLTVPIVIATIAGASVAEATAINVAEFRWTTIVDPGPPCPASSEDPACVPTDPFTLSVFALTNIWDGPEPGATLFDNRLTLPSGDLTFFDLEPDFPFNFDQLAEAGIPAFAGVDVSFLFEGAVVSLSATLTEPDTFAVLRFVPTQPIPEPGTLALVGSGVTFALARRIRRRRQAAAL